MPFFWHPDFCLCMCALVSSRFFVFFCIAVSNYSKKLINWNFAGENWEWIVLLFVFGLSF